MSTSAEPSFEPLLREAERHPTSGWDFSWLGRRYTTERLPWDFDEIVDRYARQSPDLLDMGTGGGEWLAALPHRPRRTVATEAWPPNLPVAIERLSPLKVEVVQVEAAPDNTAPNAQASTTRLPFPDDSFHLITNRHESFVAREVARILSPGGYFVTQQMGDGTYREVRELFDVPVGDEKPFTLAMAVAQIARAGLTVKDSGEAQQAETFRDVGALAWYLRMIPWEVPGFTIEGQRERLAQLHDRVGAQGPIVVHLPCFYLAAMKP